jgi:hypothetical protein
MAASNHGESLLRRIFSRETGPQPNTTKSLVYDITTKRLIVERLTTEERRGKNLFRHSFSTAMTDVTVTESKVNTDDTYLRMAIEGDQTPVWVRFWDLNEKCWKHVTLHFNLYSAPTTKDRQERKLYTQTLFVKRS